MDTKFLPKFMNVEYNLLNSQNYDNIINISEALSSKTRLCILGILYNHPKTFSEIAKECFITVSSATFHLKILGKAKLINIEFVPNKKGKLQMCYLNTITLLMFFSYTSVNQNSKVLNYSMPVGHYVDADLMFVSGFATKNEQIMFDEGNYYLPERMNAEIIWCKSGFITYAFTNVFIKNNKIKELNFSLEICSETINYCNTWKSDITFSINNIELLTYTSPGDFGDRPGNFHPLWWPDGSTQYGELRKISIKSDGVYFDNNLINKNIIINDLGLEKGNSILFKIENKKDARYIGGFNIFGKAFGDYPQDIEMNVIFE